MSDLRTISFLVAALAPQVLAQSLPTGDYFSATPPNAANLSTVRHEVADFTTFATTAVTLRNDIPGTVRAIEPMDGGRGTVLVLAEDASVTPPSYTVYGLLSPFLIGPVARPSSPMPLYAASPGDQIFDVKNDGFAGGFLTLEMQGTSMVLQRHTPAGLSTTTVPSMAQSGSLAVDIQNGEIYVVDSAGIVYRFDTALGTPLTLFATRPPLLSAADVAIDNSNGRPDRLVIAGDDGTGAGVFRHDSGGLQVSRILGGPATSLSVDFEGNVSCLLSGGIPLIVPTTGSFYSWNPTGTLLTAASSTGRHAFDSFNSPHNTQMSLLPTPALVGDTTMDYTLNTQQPLLSLSYAISPNYCLPCSVLAPNAELLVDLSNPAASLITVPVPTGTAFSYPMPLTTSLNGVQFFVQMLAIDVNGNLVASNAVSQTIGLRPAD